jgi:hypothetical protein
MQQYSLAEFKKINPKTLLGHTIYLVRDGETVFYIGQSRRDTVTRFHEHLHGPSRLGELILANMPAADAWMIELYTLADCRPFVQQKSLFPQQEWEHFDLDAGGKSNDSTTASCAKPDFNPEPRPLPDRYQGAELAATASRPAEQSFQSAPQRVWQNRLQLQGWVRVEDAHGRLHWQHPHGRTFTTAEMETYRRAGRLPPTR